MKTVLPTCLMLVCISLIGLSCDKKQDQKSTIQANKQNSGLDKMKAWYVLSSSSAGFEILMPTEPKKQQKKEDTDNGLVTTTAYLSIKDNAAYSVVVTNMPLRVANGIDPEKEFDDTVKKLQKKISGTILKQKSEEMNGNKSMTFSMSGTGPFGKTLYRVKLLRVGQNTIQLMTAHPMSEDMASDALRFFNSFKLEQTP